jgi:two-component system chemotaxis response regulator CheB
MLGSGATIKSATPALAGQPEADRPIRVMVVDDSAVVRGLVSRWIEEEPVIVVVARHANGKLAVDDVARSAPDLMLLDIDMPVMDGLQALPLLLRARPEVRVLMVSTLTKRNAEISFKALSLGALD